MGKHLSQEEFLEKAVFIHKNNFDYSKVKYINSHKKIIIICKQHGDFLITPANHLFFKRGCQECTKIKLREKSAKSILKFIEDAKLIHNNKYDYSKSIYKNNNTKIIIICKIHAEFEQTPTHHLSGQGCQKCAKTTSKSEINWLNSLNIPQIFRGKTLKINNKLFKPDAIDEKNKIIYEFYGDFWHGNPKVFDPSDINKAVKKTYGELYKNTLEKEEFLKNAGYKIISIWENDWNKL